MSAYRLFVLRRIRDEALAAAKVADAAGDRVEFMRHKKAWADACEEIGRQIVPTLREEVDHAPGA